ncbi:MAG: DUF4147 domain-containing protein [Thermoanaerobaculia bacterium]
MASGSERRLLERLYRAALAGADPEAAVLRALGEARIERALAGARRVGAFAAGKAAAGMARAALAALGPVPFLAVLPRGHPARGLARSAVAFAAHPEPDVSSVAAARRALRFFARFGEGDAILCLISGGASSLLALPRPGLTLAAKRRAVRALSDSGASILAVNLLRASLSAVKAGRLGRSTRARLITLALSDVPGDRAAAVGSGPTVRGARGDLVSIVASNAAGLAAAAREARRGGLAVVREGARLAGESAAAGRRLARRARGLAPGTLLLAGGETVVTLGSALGRGGRCLEIAAGAARELAGSSGITVLAAGSDGRDGSSGAAGAFADGVTADRARRERLELEDILERHDTRRLFARLGGLFVTGPTGGNVGDWVFVFRR